MARAQSIPDEQILDAVREAFIEQGYHVNSTELAKRAKVSEGTLFRRFGTKEKLFQAAMGLPTDMKWFRLTESLAGTGSLRDNLQSIAREMASLLTILLPRINAMIHSGFSLESFMNGQGSHVPPPVRGARLLTEFFTAEQELGRVGPGDPEVMARLFMGLVRDSVTSELHGFSGFFSDTHDQFLCKAIDMLLKGLAGEAKGS